MLFVWGSAANDVWAVGYRGFAGIPATGVLTHWDGQRWSLSPDSPAQTLYAIWGSGPDDVWVGGTGVILHYHAGAWSSVLAADIH